MIVVDTNVIFYLLNGGTNADAAQRLFDQDPDWVAPRLWLDEFLNILATYERNNIINQSQAAELLDAATALMENGSFDLPPDLILSTARRTGCTAYDSQYIALAEERGLKLYTWDKKILKACPDVAKEPS